MGGRIFLGNAFKSFASRGALLALGLSLSPIIAQAEPDNIELPKSSVDKYRIESQYGPEIAVMKPRYNQENRMELGVGASVSTVSSLVRTASVTGSFVYHMNQRHAIEPIWFGFNFYKAKTGFVQTEIADKKPNLKGTLSVEMPKFMMAASYLYTPYYTKMRMGDRSVAHFDVYLGAGFAMVKGEQTFLNDRIGESKMRPGVSLAGGVRFLFDPRWALRLEVRDIIHPQTNFGADSLTNSIQMMASLNVFFGSFRQ